MDKKLLSELTEKLQQSKKNNNTEQATSSLNGRPWEPLEKINEQQQDSSAQLDEKVGDIFSGSGTIIRRTTVARRDSQLAERRRSAMCMYGYAQVATKSAANSVNKRLSLATVSNPHDALEGNSSGASSSQPKKDKWSPRVLLSSFSKKNERGAPPPPPPPPPPPSKMSTKIECAQTEHSKSKSTQCIIVSRSDRRSSGRTVFDTHFALSNEMCEALQKNFEEVKIAGKNEKKTGRNESSAELQWLAIALSQLKKNSSTVAELFEKIDKYELETISTDFLQKLVAELQKKKLLNFINSMDFEKPSSPEVALQFAWETLKRPTLLVHLESEIYSRVYEEEKLELKENLCKVEEAAEALLKPVMSNLAGCLLKTVNYLNQGSKIPKTETFMLKEFGRILDQKGKTGKNIAELYKDQFAEWREELDYVQQKLAATRIGFSQVQQDLKVYNENSRELFYRVKISRNTQLYSKYEPMMKNSNRGIANLDEHSSRVKKLECQLQSSFCTVDGLDVMIEEVLRALSLIFKSFEVENKMKTWSSQTTQIR